MEAQSLHVFKYSQTGLAEFFRRSEKINSIVFCGGVYVAENTSHGAECRIVRLWRTTEAWSAVQALFVKEGVAFFDKLNVEAQSPHVFYALAT